MSTLLLSLFLLLAWRRGILRVCHFPRARIASNRCPAIGQASPVQPPSPLRFDATRHVSVDAKPRYRAIMMPHLYPQKSTLGLLLGSGGRAQKSAQVARCKAYDTYFFISVHRSAFPSVYDSSWVWYVATDKSERAYPGAVGRTAMAEGSVTVPRMASWKHHGEVARTVKKHAGEISM